MEFNNEFFNQLSRSPAVAQLVTHIAAEIAVDAVKTAPRDTNAYANSIHIETKYQDRFVALVVAGDKKALLIEAKTGNLVRALNRKKKRRA